MRSVICLCAAALLFAAGCSKTNDSAPQDNPMPAEQSTPSTPPPPDQPPPDTSSENATPPPADQPPSNPPQ